MQQNDTSLNLPHTLKCFSQYQLLEEHTHMCAHTQAHTST